MRQPEAPRGSLPVGLAIVAMALSIWTATAAAQGRPRTSGEWLVGFKPGEREKFERSWQEKGFETRKLPGLNILACRPTRTGIEGRTFAMARVRQHMLARSGEAAPPKEGEPPITPVNPDILFRIPNRPLTERNAARDRADVPVRRVSRSAAGDAPPAAGVPDDFFYAKPHWLWGLEQIHADWVWPIRHDAGKIVAVLDTGIDYRHDDLKQNLWLNRGARRRVDGPFGARYLPDSQRNLDLLGEVRDDNGHGTHCAGIIGAVGDNDYGSVGVNWHVGLMAVKVLNRSGEARLQDILLGISYAARHGARIINLSLASEPMDPRIPENAVSLLEAAIKAHPGILFVAAAGNSGKGPDGRFRPVNNNDAMHVYPGSLRLDNLLCVMSVDRDEAPSAFSFHGRQTVDIAAPGGDGNGRLHDILSTSLADKEATSFRWRAGSSMATAFVSGAAALCWAAHPEWKHGADVKNYLMDHARKPGKNTLAGLCQSEGIVDLEALARELRNAKAKQEPAAPKPARDDGALEEVDRLQRQGAPAPIAPRFRSAAPPTDNDPAEESPRPPDLPRRPSAARGQTIKDIAREIDPDFTMKPAPASDKPTVGVATESLSPVRDMKPAPASDKPTVPATPTVAEGPKVVLTELDLRYADPCAFMPPAPTSRYVPSYQLPWPPPFSPTFSLGLPACCPDASPAAMVPVHADETDEPAAGAATADDLRNIATQLEEIRQQKTAIQREIEKLKALQAAGHATP